MARQECVLTVFVASPSNVQAERTRLGEVIDELNMTWSRTIGIRLELLGWETHAYPSFGIDAQDVINRQIPAYYDIFIGIMWAKFGSPTGRAGSGTEEEFMRAKARWDQDNSSVQLMLYFKNDQLAPSDIDPSQLAKVHEFRNSLPGKGGLYWAFSGTENFGSLVRVHLTRVVQAWHAKQTNQSHTLHSKACDDTPSGVTFQQLVEADNEAGLFDFGKQVSESFADAGQIVDRIGKATESLNEKILSQAKLALENQAAGTADPYAIRRVIVNVATDMTDYAQKVEHDIPTLKELMNSGLNAFSQIISFIPEVRLEHEDPLKMEKAVEILAALKEFLFRVEQHVEKFRLVIATMPRVTGELNLAKRAVVRALQNLIDLLRNQQQLMAQILGSAREVLTAQGSDPNLNANATELLTPASTETPS
jgi:hypothetical protein